MRLEILRLFSKKSKKNKIMITEDYVSFEVAKLLKEKGFDGTTNCYYFDDSNKRTLLYSPFKENYNDGITNKEFEVSSNINSIRISAPTLAMAMKWLRKVHEIFIRTNISFLYPIRYYCEIFCYGDNLKTQQDVTTENFESPEEACEAAIKYCLENLI